MASKPVVIHRLAERETAEAVRWYRARDPRVADRFADEVERALTAVERQPELMATDSAGDRRRLLYRFPYAVVYREADRYWLVLAIAHLKRRPGYWRRRTRRP